jgi:hypothetical protein
MFAKLTGPRSAKSVILATTMWDKLNAKFDDGDKREKILKEEYWNVMIRHGAAVERFLNDSDSAWSIIDNFVNPNADDQKAVLLLQEESVAQEQPFPVTGADLDRSTEKPNKTMPESSECRSSGSGSHGAQESE